MMKNDSVKRRKCFYIFQLMNFLIQDLLEVAWLIFAHYYFLNNMDDDECTLFGHCLYGQMPFLAIALGFIAVRFLWHIYCVLILR